MCYVLVCKSNNVAKRRAMVRQAYAISKSCFIVGHAYVQRSLFPACVYLPDYRVSLTRNREQLCKGTPVWCN